MEISLVAHGRAGRRRVQGGGGRVDRSELRGRLLLLRHSAGERATAAALVLPAALVLFLSSGPQAAITPPAADSGPGAEASARQPVSLPVSQPASQLACWPASPLS